MIATQKTNKEILDHCAKCKEFYSSIKKLMKDNYNLRCAIDEQEQEILRLNELLEYYNDWENEKEKYGQ